jgi:hypothetical protein
MTDKLDLKDLSLQLYGKEVEITLADKSASQKLYKTSVLKGILVGRIWGKVLIDGNHEDTVVALMLRQGNKEIEILCKDINTLHLAVKHLLALVNYNFGKFSVNGQLEQWHKLSWERFSEELKLAGISLKNESDNYLLEKTFKEHKEQVLFIEQELNRHDEIVVKNKSKV